MQLKIILMCLVMVCGLFGTHGDPAQFDPKFKEWLIKVANNEGINKAINEREKLLQITGWAQVKVREASQSQNPNVQSFFALLWILLHWGDAEVGFPKSDGNVILPWIERLYPELYLSFIKEYVTIQTSQRGNPHKTVNTQNAQTLKDLAHAMFSIFLEKHGLDILNEYDQADPTKIKELLPECTSPKSIRAKMNEIQVVKRRLSRSFSSASLSTASGPPSPTGSQGGLSSPQQSPWSAQPTRARAQENPHPPGSAPQLNPNDWEPVD